MVSPPFRYRPKIPIIAKTSMNAWTGRAAKSARTPEDRTTAAATKTTSWTESLAKPTLLLKLLYCWPIDTTSERSIRWAIPT